MIVETAHFLFKNYFQKVDVVVSALPYQFNFKLAKIAVETKTHFVDLGGNNTIVEDERSLFSKAKKNEITIIPDSGLAPGLVSVITRDIVDHMDTVDYVKLRVGGLPRHPQPPLNYQIVFSPYGLINEYVEDAIILDKGTILERKSMTEVESIEFPKPFGTMEAFLTSGGCSTLPFTYKEKIGYLDYKTIRYPGHCEKIKTIIDLGFADETKINIAGQSIVPRDVFAFLLTKNVPTTGEDVVLLKVLSQGTINGKKKSREYLIIDYYDTNHGITAVRQLQHAENQAHCAQIVDILGFRVFDGLIPLGGQKQQTVLGQSGLNGRTEFSRPTNNGSTMLGNTTTSRTASRGRVEGMSISCSSSSF